MTGQFRMHGVKLNAPERVSIVELHSLICVKLFKYTLWTKSKLSFVDIQKLFVDIES